MATLGKSGGSGVTLGVSFDTGLGGVVEAQDLIALVVSLAFADAFLDSLNVSVGAALFNAVTAATCCSWEPLLLHKRALCCFLSFAEASTAAFVSVNERTEVN